MSPANLNTRAECRPGLRDRLKCFPVHNAPENTLQWDASIDAEQGSGVRVALLDSGICWSDPIFAEASLRGRDFTGLGGLFDATCHGSANAALLVGQAEDGTTGLIPECELLVAKVLGLREWKTTVMAITSALRWAVRAGTDVIILPFGTCRGSAAIRREVHIALSQGCRIFAAAGNRGPDQLYFPAWLPGVTAVSALGCDGQIFPECCACHEVDIYCWGEQVPYPGAGFATGISGSSPATVLAAGVTALRLAALRKSGSTINDGSERRNQKGENNADRESYRFSDIETASLLSAGSH